MNSKNDILIMLMRLTTPKVKNYKKKGTKLLTEQTENPSYKSEVSLTNCDTSDTKPSTGFKPFFNQRFNKANSNLLTCKMCSIK